MKTYADRIAEIAAREQEINTALPALREARENALGDGDNTRADKLRLEIERAERELQDQRTAASVVERREKARLEAEAAKRRQVARARLADLSRSRSRIARKIDLAWGAIEAALQELDALEQKVRVTSSEAETGTDVSRRLGVNARMLHRGAVLAIAPRAALLLGIDRLPASVRRPLEVSFKSLTSAEVEPFEGEAA